MPYTRFWIKKLSQKTIAEHRIDPAYPWFLCYEYKTKAGRVLQFYREFSTYNRAKSQLNDWKLAYLHTADTYNERAVLDSFVVDKIFPPKAKK